MISWLNFWGKEGSRVWGRSQTTLRRRGTWVGKWYWKFQPFTDFPLQGILSQIGKGWICEIWKNVQVNIHYTYTASTDTNDTSEESLGIQL